jgi:roadblock/LC7 domain-containing protein
MSRSSELLTLPGVVAAGLFSRKGFLEEFEGPFPDSEASGLTGLCAAITLTMEMQGLLLDRLSGEPGWQGCRGWAMWSPERSIVAVDDSMCILQTAAASFNQVFSAMRTAAGITESETE